MNKFKNIGIYAHVDAGKTSLTEQLLFASGAIRSLGSVDEGNTHTDTMDLEKKRGISIMSTPTSYELHGEKVNIIDTPGHVDFVAEVERSMVILDAAILVISAKEGIQSHTKLLYGILKERQVPTLIFINKIDRIGVEIDQVISAVESQLSAKVLVTQKVFHTGDKQCKVSELFDVDTSDLTESLSEVDDSLLSMYMEEEPITFDHLLNSAQEMTKQCQITPVLFGSAKHGISIKSCLEGINKLLPPYDAPSANTIGGVVFKVSRDHMKMKEVYVKLTSGHIAIREMIGEDKVTKIRRFNHGHLETVDVLYAGDVGILQGMHHAAVGDTFGHCNLSKMDSISLPTLKASIEPMRPSQRPVLLQALSVLSESDPYMTFKLSTVTDEIELNLFGAVQMEIIKDILKTRFGLEVIFDDPATIYMETLKTSANELVQIRQKGYPFDAAVGFHVEPLSLGSGIVYTSNVEKGLHSKSMENAVKEGAFEYLDQGLKGWQLTDMKIVFDYFDSVKLHVIPSSTPKDHRDLAPLVLFAAIKSAGTKLLWPIYHYKLTVPIDQMGRGISDVAAMSGSMDEPKIVGDMCVIEGQVPVEYAKQYHQDVHGYTSGMGYFETRFVGYENAPDQVNKERKKFKIDPANRGKYLLHLMRGL